MVNEQAVIISNKRITGNYWHCVIRAPKIAKGACAGQFINIQVSCGLDPLLRRPFSIHNVKGNNIAVMYEVLGKATKIVAGKKSGDILDMIGPLGNGFDYRAQGTGHRAQVIVAGGMGVAPLVFLAEKLVKPNIKILVLLGAKSKNLILCEGEFKRLGCEIKIATDDGSRGFKGRVTELLNDVLLANSQEPMSIYSCGPRPMLRELSRLSAQYGVPAQVSLEEHMSCGIGACLGCVVDTKQGYRRVCKDGPVFDAGQIIWRE